jgi:RNA polymerase sigma factor (sigma-70 family)
MDLLLFAKWKATGSVRLRNRLVTENMGIVHQVVRAFANGPDYDDMAQAGAIGLMVALDRFDPTRGAFITYAKPWVLYEIQKQVAKKKGTTKSTKRYSMEDMALAMYGQAASAILDRSFDDLEEYYTVYFASTIQVDGVFDESETHHDLDRLLAGMSRQEVDALLALADGASSEEIATALGIPAESKAARAKARGQMAYALLRVRALARREDPEPDPLPPPPPPRAWPVTPAEPTGLPCWACILKKCDGLHP